MPLSRQAHLDGRPSLGPITQAFILNTRRFSVRCQWKADHIKLLGLEVYDNFREFAASDSDEKA